MCSSLPRSTPSMSLHATLTFCAPDLRMAVRAGCSFAVAMCDCLPSRSLPGGRAVGDTHLAQRVGNSGDRLPHLVAADRADAADAKGLELRQLAGVEDEAALLGRFVEALEVVGL